MPSVCRAWSARALCLGLVAAPAAAWAGDEGPAAWYAPTYTEVFGEIELEGTLFAEPPSFDRQVRNDVSVAGEVTGLVEWADGDVTLRVTPFGRVDRADHRRTHWDIREAKIDVIDGALSATVGADTVFWGKTEVVHLVDIINQTDTVEDLDDEDRLGQPLVRFGYLTDYGLWEAFYMPYFRDRTFPSAEGRLRGPVPVNENLSRFDTDAEEWTPSFAGRFAGTFGDFDIGLSAFHGLSRDPVFLFEDGQLIPLYERITQAGFDGQFTSGATLWKAEAIGRFGQKNARLVEEDFGAFTGGFEHTLFGVYESNADLGLIVEYAWDSRGDDALTAFQNDVIGGVRLALNDEQDTALLVTGSADAANGGIGFRLEGERRIGTSWKAEVEGQAFVNQDRGTAQGILADDTFVRLKMTYFF